MKKLTITQRELVRNWAKWKVKLHSGEVDQLVIPENGHVYLLTHRVNKPQPGDIQALLEKLEKIGPKERIKPIRIDGTIKSLKLMEKLWGNKQKKEEIIPSTRYAKHPSRYQHRHLPS